MQYLCFIVHLIVMWAIDALESRFISVSTNEHNTCSTIARSQGLDLASHLQGVIWLATYREKEGNRVLSDVKVRSVVR